MDVNEYRERIKAIDVQAELDKKQLGKEFALSHNTVSIGDIISDHISSIKVEAIKIYYSSPPQCVYEGIEYTKDGKPKKRVSRSTVFHQNLNRSKP